MSLIIRSIIPSDLDEMLMLCAEHAEFERAAYSSEGKREKLEQLIFQSPPELYVFFAEVDKQVAGYATYSMECSTWDAELYAHMDCLYVRPSFRNLGIGECLVEEILKQSKASLLQWQTPEWNTNAIRFYERIGATSKSKQRFYLKGDGFVKRG